jgi:hypothetical protein
MDFPKAQLSKAIEHERWLTQTEFAEDGGTGNCAEAALASILGLPLTAVPRFHQPNGSNDGYWSAFDAFVRSRGFEPRRKDSSYIYEGLYLASGTTVRNTNHMVIYKGGELFHDPHPDGVGLSQVSAVIALIPFDPRGSTYMRSCTRDPNPL